jgi:hypothetical protein
MTMEHRTRRARTGVERTREKRPQPGKKVSLIQLMTWESEFIMSGREKTEHYGAAFCKDFQIDNDRLAQAGDTLARQIIFARYVTTDVRYHQHVAAAHEDLAELYPVDSPAT